MPKRFILLSRSSVIYWWSIEKSTDYVIQDSTYYTQIFDFVEYDLPPWWCASQRKYSMINNFNTSSKSKQKMITIWSIYLSIYQQLCWFQIITTLFYLRSIEFKIFSAAFPHIFCEEYQNLRVVLKNLKEIAHSYSCLQTQWQHFLFRSLPFMKE